MHTLLCLSSVRVRSLLEGRFFPKGQRHQKRLPAHINAPFHHFRIEVHRVQRAVSTESCYSHATDVIETQLSRCRLIFWLYSMFATSRSFYWLEVMICRQSLGSGKNIQVSARTGLSLSLSDFMNLHTKTTHSIMNLAFNKTLPVAFLSACIDPTIKCS